MDQLNIDYDQLPTFLVLFLVIISLFKKPLGLLLTSVTPEVIKNFLGVRSEQAAKREEHERLIQEMLLNGEIQQQVTETMRDKQREDTLIDIIRDKDRWLENVLNNKLEEMHGQQVEMIHALGAIQRHSEHTNNVLDQIHIVLARRNPAQGG